MLLAGPSGWVYSEKAGRPCGSWGQAREERDTDRGDPELRKWGLSFREEARERGRTHWWGR